MIRLTEAALLLSAAVTILLLGATPSGQTNTGEIAGVVRDAQGGVLPGATVVAEHVDSRARVERLTDGDGRYLLPSLAVGTHVVSVELSGFRRVVRSGITVGLGQTLAFAGTPNFGRIFSARSPREMQLGLKLTF